MANGDKHKFVKNKAEFDAVNVEEFDYLMGKT